VSRSLEQEITFADVPGEGRGTLELLLCLFQAAELAKQIGANGRQQMIGPERRLGPQAIDNLETCRRTFGHSDSHGPVELHHR
jgi:hypothetical protein